VIVSCKIQSESEFYNEAARAVKASRNKEAFVFVHGFNVAFRDAVYSTAQLAYDLEFSGAAILYSWPSNSSLLDYVGDLNNNDWTVPHLKSFLESLASRIGASTVHLIAHSMGNRALSNALAQIATAQASQFRPHFRQVVLTAPDIDVDTFKALAVSLKSTADRVTLYASANDRALRTSKALNGYPRAGDVSGQVVIISGVDTIDVSAVDTDFIGHSYYGDLKSLLSDIFSLLSDGKPPGQRFGLQEIIVAAGTYWRFRP
jgi:esterase/lipase superfamily enzyme